MPTWTQGRGRLYSSYGFDGGNTRTNKLTGTTYPGIAGGKQSSVRDSSATVLLGEIPADYGFSWHAPKNPTLSHYFNKTRNLAGFVDGHVGYIRFFRDDRKPQSEALEYDPPPGYDYKWSAD